MRYIQVFLGLGDEKKILFVVTYFDHGGINRALQNLLKQIDVYHHYVDVFGGRLYVLCSFPGHVLFSVLTAWIDVGRSSNQINQMKKKVLIFISSYSIGGTISSLYSLLSLIDTNQIDVDVFARSQVGFYEGKLPNCNVIDENIWLSHFIYHRNFIVKVFVRILWAIRQAFQLVGVDLYKVYNYIGGRQIHSEKYDAVIGYDETFARYISYLPAKKRINWIHCDYRRFAQGKDESKYYDKIDKVVCVSEYVKGVFSEVYPKYANKTFAIHNVINYEDIRKKANEPITDNRFITDDFTIVSCGRLDPVKQFSKIPEIAVKLKGLNTTSFRWYIIGGGDEQEKKNIENEIARYNISDCVVMLGMKNNVYPYLAKADLYVCTSSSESFPMVVNEAKVLLVPVLSNDFPSAKESIHEGVDGHLCSIEEMAENISKLIHNQMEISEGQYVSENSHIIKLFMDLFN